MVVYDERAKRVRFETLKQGDVFIAKNHEFYLKTNETFSGNCVEIRTGELCTFADFRYVSVVDAYMTVYRDRR